MTTSRKRFSKWKLALIVILCLVLVGTAGATIYVNDYYRAGAMAAESLLSDDMVTVTKRADDSIVFAPVQNPHQNSANTDAASGSGQTTSRGLVFYPGGKVEYTAYAPLMRELAEHGWHCVLVKMPFNLAVFDIDAADDIPDQFPEVDSWYVGGHSFGGAMAASFVADEDEDDFDGLLLLAAYSTADLKMSGLDVYSIYGSEDMVLNKENYEKYRANLPANVKELIIEGGCHAYFGDYGAQEGDGVPTITAADQLQATVDFLSD